MACVGYRALILKVAMAEITNMIELVQCEIVSYDHPAFSTKNDLTLGLSAVGTHIARIFDTVGHMRTGFGGRREEPSDNSKSIAIHNLFSHISNICSENQQLGVDDSLIERNTRKSVANLYIQEHNERDQIWCLLTAAAEECGGSGYVETRRPFSYREAIMPSKWLMLCVARLMEDGFRLADDGMRINPDHFFSKFAHEFARFKPDDEQVLAELSLGSRGRVLTERTDIKKQLDAVHRAIEGMRCALARINGCWNSVELKDEIRGCWKSSDLKKGMKATAIHFLNLESYVRTLKPPKKKDANRPPVIIHPAGAISPIC
jgi:hypothetical protein